MKRGAIGLLVALCALAACGGHDSGPVTPVPGAPAAAPGGVAPGALARPMSVTELPEPPLVKSVNGVAKVDLEAAQNYTNGMPTFDYKGANDVAPTIEVKPGDTIVLNLQNNLPTVPPPAGMQGGMQMDGMQGGMQMDGMKPNTGARQDM